MLLLLGQLLLIGILSYLWGSLPPGYWIGKVLRGKDFDIRDQGSHKIGATNVYRVLGPGPAAIVFLLDLSKGVLPTLLAIYVPLFHAQGWGPCVAGLLALLGHRFPLFIGFQGGRSVLTGAGAMLVISLPLSLLIFGISLVCTVLAIATTRYVSFGSLVGCLVTAICSVIFGFLGWLSLPAIVFLIAAPALVIFFHSDNIERLVHGTERKLGQKEAVVPTTSGS